jgi:hypothetical protein
MPGLPPCVKGAAYTMQVSPVSLSWDGTVLAVGGTTGISVGTWVYRYGGSAWVESPGMPLRSSGPRVTSVSLSSDGTVLAAGAPGSGPTDGGTGLWRYDGSAWVESPGTPLLGGSGPAEGMTVSLSSDGSVLAITGPGGGTWVYATAVGCGPGTYLASGSLPVECTPAPAAATPWATPRATRPARSAATPAHRGRRPASPARRAPSPRPPAPSRACRARPAPSAPPPGPFRACRARRGLIPRRRRRARPARCSSAPPRGAPAARGRGRGTLSSWWCRRCAWCAAGSGGLPQEAGGGVGPARAGVSRRGGTGSRVSSWRPCWPSTASRTPTRSGPSRWVGGPPAASQR